MLRTFVGKYINVLTVFNKNPYSALHPEPGDCCPQPYALFV